MRNLKYEDWAHVGEIELGEKVMISDPCYELDTWCQHVLNCVKPGKYKCSVRYFYDPGWCEDFRRVAEISLVHEDYNAVAKTPIDAHIGIDSGQCGVYDLDYYKEKHTDNEHKDEWYGMVCKKTYIRFDNPNYIPFHESKYYVPTPSCYDILIKHGIDTSLLNDENAVFPGEVEKEIDAVMDAYYDAKYAYEEDIKISMRKTEAMAADVIENKGFVSCSAYGDGGALLYVNKNSKGEIVSIRLKY